jgi:cytochrome c biogenesis protein CcmG/thiol:disulfide interchange protein DsbE
LQWLQQHGNPYDLIFVDPKGQYGIDLGVYGVPETFVMSANNQVVHKQVGPVSGNFANDVAQALATGVEVK